MATCTDTVKNQSETGVDCGGPCPPCLSGQPCNEPGDCYDNVCTAGLCTTGACTDMVMNGTETGVRPTSSSFSVTIAPAGELPNVIFRSMQPESSDTEPSSNAARSSLRIVMGGIVT